MSKRAAINAIWRMTLISFACVEIGGVIVVVSVFFSNDKISKYQIVGTYLLFLLFSGFVYVTARHIRVIVKASYGE